MRLLNENFSFLKLDIVLGVFVLAMILIVITMKVNKEMRYASFLVYSAYSISTILNVAAYVAFTWYLALPVGLLIADLISRWVKKQLALAEEEEKKGGFGLTKKKRMAQMEQYILKASPVEQNRVKKLGENPVKFQRAMFMTTVAVIGFLIAVAIEIGG